MQMWLATAAVVPLVGSAAAVAQMKALQPVAPIVVSGRAPQVSLPPDGQFAPSTALQRGMIAEEDVAPNSLLGVGLAHMSGRPARSLRWTEEPTPTRNPGVSFVLKF